MPVAICPQCCRDYYLPAGSEDEARCEKCACPLVGLDELRTENAGGLVRDMQLPARQELPEDCA